MRRRVFRESRELDYSSAPSYLREPVKSEDKAKLVTNSMLKYNLVEIDESSNIYLLNS
ncbi:hypothetical protein BHE74_00049721 [Ensete ventricosum]|nr:hypothetical protein BHE74_00049721 [Ensete ventricosum]